MEDTSRLISQIEVRVRNLETWSAEHDGRINVLWSDQIEINKKLSLNVTEVELRIRHLERRFTWVVGCASGIGAIAGTFPLLVVIYFKLI